MLSVILALVLGAIIACASHFGGEIGWVWSVIWGMLGAILLQVLIGWIVRKKIMVINNKIQQIVIAGQERVNRKMHQFQLKPPGGTKTIQKILEKEQEGSIRDALAAMDLMLPYCKWNLLLGKQVCTMKMQFHYQLREFGEVDKLMPKTLLMDVMGVAMKMARQYKNDDSGFEKTFEKKIGKFSGDEAALIYGLYTWILVKKGEIDKAIKILAEAKESTDNETLAKNWEHLANGRVKKFSNAGLGEQWYALYLEEPKIKQQRQRGQRRFR